MGVHLQPVPDFSAELSSKLQQCCRGGALEWLGGLPPSTVHTHLASRARVQEGGAALGKVFAFWKEEHSKAYATSKEVCACSWLPFLCGCPSVVPLVPRPTSPLRVPTFCILQESARRKVFAQNVERINGINARSLTLPTNERVYVSRLQLAPVSGCTGCLRTVKQCALLA